MPAYEMFLIVKNLPRVIYWFWICIKLNDKGRFYFFKDELVQSIKKGAEYILKKDGIIRSFENLGFKNLPYKMKNKEGLHDSGK